VPTPSFIMTVWRLNSFVLRTVLVWGAKLAPYQHDHGRLSPLVGVTIAPC